MTIRGTIISILFLIAFALAAFGAPAPVHYDTRTFVVEQTTLDMKGTTLTLGSVTVSDSAGIRTFTLGSTNGAKIGATGNKIGFLGATPIVRPSSTTDLRQALINLGLYTTGGASPLDLNGGDFAADDAEISGTITVDHGAIATAESEGIVLKNDTPATVLIPQQNSPLVVFEAHGLDSFGADHVWEMNEKFTVDATSGDELSKFAWEFSVDEGPYVEQVYIDSLGDVGGNGYFLSGRGFLDTRGGLCDVNTLQLKSNVGDSVAIIENTAADVLRFRSVSTTANAYSFRTATLTSGTLLDGLVPEAFAGNLLNLGTSSNGTSITTSKFRVDSTGTIAQDAVTAPTLLNSWVNYGGSQETAGYYKDHSGRVWLSGLIKDGTTTVNTAMFTLPSGYRPVSRRVYAVDNSGALGEVQVFETGDVKIFIGGNTYLSLEGISFRTD